MSNKGKHINRAKLLHFKVLAALLWDATPGVEFAIDEPCQMQVRLGPLSKATGIPSHSLRECFVILNMEGYITGLQLGFGKAAFSMAPPFTRRFDVAAAPAQEQLQ